MAVIFLRRLRNKTAGKYAHARLCSRYVIIIPIISLPRIKLCNDFLNKQKLKCFIRQPKREIQKTKKLKLTIITTDNVNLSSNYTARKQIKNGCVKISD